MNDTTKRNLAFLNQYNLPEVEGLNPDLVIDAIYGVYPAIYSRVYHSHLAFSASQGGGGDVRTDGLLSEKELSLVAKEAIVCGSSLAYALGQTQWIDIFRNFGASTSETSGQNQRRSA